MNLSKVLAVTFGGCCILSLVLLHICETRLSVVKRKLDISQSEVHMLKMEAVTLGVGHWRGVDEGVSLFEWKDPDGKLKALPTSWVSPVIDVKPKR